MSHKIHPAILCGGSGTRLWPLSRRSHPKQLLSLVDPLSLLQVTARRFADTGLFAPPIALCSEAYRFIIAEQMHAAGMAPGAVILEPAGRNTAPAAAVAALWARRQDPEALVLLSPSDHVIGDLAAFRTAIDAAAEIAVRTGALVTFGIKPDRPETGYGYIEAGEPIDGTTALAVTRFVEKPDLATARAYVDGGRHLWNSGLFLFRATDFLSELARLEPDMLAACEEAFEKARTDLDFVRLDEESFGRSPSNSIDYAVMERTERAAVVPVSMGWSDVGSWSALRDVAEQDAAGNAVWGDVLAIDTRNSLVRSEGPLVVTYGLDNLVVVATKDAVLVSTADAAQDLKTVVSRLEALKREETESHARVFRPWGWFETMDLGPGFKVKRIAVKPGQRLSLQSHKHRAEHWVVVNGVAEVTRGEEVTRLEANQSTYIPAGTTHRLGNAGDSELQIIEVQSGGYLGEDDIVRFDDIYGRS
ncbi:mannose-1-phosphate guanylyltransferase/mannose-6-phosphate isomerase [Iodidimonas sp. SYSU 1G8]|uniref:mannose-1-phosphate guanylyltransferase/mannose-6-phosphate isomerase n=1 Tax=Iodidimonas sp. SYSU 1G8 TaxID=3133967 RepID=UPI0031FF11FC